MWDSTENQIELVLIRHGATKANKEKRYLGKTDESLSIEGKEKLKTKKYPQVELLFFSPMKRCMETAACIYPALWEQEEAKKIAVPDWCEMDFGSFEGKNYQELNGDEDYQNWIDSGGTLPFPGGESRETFILRCKRGFKQALTFLCEHHLTQMAGARAAAVVHGGTIMALLSSYGAGDYFDYQCPNGEGYTVQVHFRRDGGGTVIEDSIYINQIKRLETKTDEIS